MVVALRARVGDNPEPYRALVRELREALRDAVREKKLEEAYATWAQELRGRAYVEYREPPQ